MKALISTPTEIIKVHWIDVILNRAPAKMGFDMLNNTLFTGLSKFQTEIKYKFDCVEIVIVKQHNDDNKDTYNVKFKENEFKFNYHDRCIELHGGILHNVTKIDNVYCYYDYSVKSVNSLLLNLRDHINYITNLP